MERATAVKTVTPQALATKLGITPKAVRQILRDDYPRDAKQKRWEIPVTLAKRVERDHKAKAKEKEAKKQAEIKKQLEGEA